MRTGIFELAEHPIVECSSSTPELDTNMINPLPNHDPRGKLDKCRLELILGCMGSGKSTEIRRRLTIRSLYKTVMAVSTTQDTRYGNEGIITHDGITTPCTRVEKLADLLKLQEYHDAEVIGIDEGNFFEEIYTFVVEQLEATNKTFIVSGLNGDKDRKFFGNLHELIPEADDITHLKAICKRCGDGTNAPFSIDLVRFEGTVKVGGSETYESVCRKHYSQIRFSQSVDNLKRSSPHLKI